MSEIKTWRSRLTAEYEEPCGEVLDAVQAEIDELRKKLSDFVPIWIQVVAERDALQAKLAALEGQEPVAVVGSGYALYWQGSEPLSKLLERFDTVKVGSFLYTAAGAAPVPENWRSAVAMAYGHLWHVNNEPMAPIPLRSEESASYAARKLLRDLLTTEERGEAINSVRAMLSSAPKDAP